jgi:hypothetical protein
MDKRNLTLAAIAVLTLNLFGCATEAPVLNFIADNSPNHASIIFFRERNYFNSLIDANILIDGKGVGPLKNGQTLTANISPGDFKIQIKSDTDLFDSLILPIQTEKSGTYFYEVLPQSVYIGLPHGGVFVMPREQGPVSACNHVWCIAALSSDIARAKIEKLSEHR